MDDTSVKGGTPFNLDAALTSPGHPSREIRSRSFHVRTALSVHSHQILAALSLSLLALSPFSLTLSLSLSLSGPRSFYTDLLTQRHYQNSRTAGALSSEAVT